MIANPRLSFVKTASAPCRDSGSSGRTLVVTDRVGNLTQTGVLTVGGTSSFTTSATDATITLTNTGNLLTGAASLNTSGTGGNASLINAKATVLGASNVGGNLTVVRSAISPRPQR